MIDPLLVGGALLAVGGLLLIRRTFPFHPAAGFSLTSGFGPRGDGFHGAVDFGTPSGTPLINVAPGKVIAAHHADDGPAGLHVIVAGSGLWADLAWSYSHLQRVDVSIGAELAAGDVVGLSGRSGRVRSSLPADAPDRGAHLHFVVMRRTPGGPVTLRNAIDPLPLLPR